MHKGALVHAREHNPSDVKDGLRPLQHPLYEQKGSKIKPL